MTDRASDVELQAIQQMIAALEPLDAEARSRVVKYVFERLGIEGRDQPLEFRVLSERAVSAEQSGVSSRPPQGHPVDIRSLREQKSPRSAMEMAAVAAYYLSEAAPPAERKSEMTAADLTRLFKQAGYPLPGTPKMTLVHAKNAGYLDPGPERGTYSLNPVGYNLVAHKLPASESAPASRSNAPRKPTPRRAKPGPKRTGRPSR